MASPLLMAASMTRFALLAFMLGCGSTPQHGDDAVDGGSGTPPADSTTTVASGTILDTIPTQQYFVRSLDVGRNLMQFSDHVSTGLTGPEAVHGTVLRGQLFGDLAVAAQPPSSQVATPPMFCRYNATTDARDPSFGTNGCTSAPYAYFSTLGIAKVPDGYRALIQKNCSNGCPDAQRSFALVKLSAAGVLDPTFGTDMGIAYSTILPDLSALAFAPQSNGDLVVNGYTGLYVMKLFRIHPDGTLDTTFGTAGFADGANGARVRVLADDSIFVEASYNGIERIDRYTKDGAPLPGWGTNGSVDLATVTQLSFENNLNQTAAELDAQDRVVIGYSHTDTFDGPNKFFVLRLTASGALDTSFGAGGMMSLDPATTWIYGIGFEADGRIVFGTSTTHGGMAGHIQP